jgi:hypothetical protein
MAASTEALITLGSTSTQLAHLSCLCKFSSTHLINEATYWFRAFITSLLLGFDDYSWEPEEAPENPVRDLQIDKRKQF